LIVPILERLDAPFPVYVPTGALTRGGRGRPPLFRPAIPACAKRSWVRSRNADFM